MTLQSEFGHGIGEEIKDHYHDYELRIEEMPPLDYIYPKLGGAVVCDTFSSYPIPLQPSSPDDVAIYLHSSGSTGLPKAIPQTNRILCGWAGVGGYQIEGFKTCTALTRLVYQAFQN